MEIRQYRGKENNGEKIDDKLLDAYLQRNIDKVLEIERSLDRGIFALPASDLAEPILQTLKLPAPKISKTPYSDQITGLTDFYREAKESEMA